MEEYQKSHNRFIRLTQAEKIMYLMEPISRTFRYSQKNGMEKKDPRFMPCMNMMRIIRRLDGTHRDCDEQENLE